LAVYIVIGIIFVSITSCASEKGSKRFVVQELFV